MVRMIDVVFLVCAVTTALATSAIAVEMIFGWSQVWPQMNTLLSDLRLPGLTATAQVPSVSLP